MRHLRFGHRITPSGTQSVFVQAGELPIMHHKRVNSALNKVSSRLLDRFGFSGSEHRALQEAL